MFTRKNEGVKDTWVNPLESLLPKSPAAKSAESAQWTANGLVESKVKKACEFVIRRVRQSIR